MNELCMQELCDPWFENDGLDMILVVI